MDVVEWIGKHEGFRQFVYDDKTGLAVVPGYTLVGHPTIGYGRCLDTHGVLPAEGALLRDNNIADCTADLLGIFGADRWANFGLPRQGALIDIHYNLGSGGFRGFHHMITALCNKQWEAAAGHLLDSALARELPERTQDNASVIRTGEWPS